MKIRLVNHRGSYVRHGFCVPLPFLLSLASLKQKSVILTPSCLSLYSLPSKIRLRNCNDLLCVLEFY